MTHDDFFSNEQHILSNLPTKAEKMCRYDMDDLDDKWLYAYNGERARMGQFLFFINFIHCVFLHTVVFISC